jgi:hypothetical protein
MQYHRLRKLNDRVRNGNGCDLTDIATSQAGECSFESLAGVVLGKCVDEVSGSDIAAKVEHTFRCPSLVVPVVADRPAWETVIDKSGQVNRPLVPVT